MVIEELIQESDRPVVMRALLLRHRHVNEHSHGSFPFGSRRKFSSYTSLQVSNTSTTQYFIDRNIFGFIFNKYIITIILSNLFSFQALRVRWL